MSCISSFEIKIPNISEARKVWVYTPENYSSDEAFPVIYMQDGQNLFYDTLSKTRVSWRVAETMDSLFYKTGLSCLIVGVESHNNRDTEYLPWGIKKKSSFISKDVPLSPGEEYGDFLAKVLKPYIDTNYKTMQSPKSAAIVGAGLGALT